MKTTVIRNICVIVISIVAMMLIGCRTATPPVSFYTLTSIPSDMSDSDQAHLKDIAIGLGPVRCPTLIERPQIVTRTAPNKVEHSEFHRWGGNLCQDFLNVLSDNISVLTRSHKILIYPWPTAFHPAYRIEFDVHRFDGKLGGAVLLNVTWTIMTQGNDALYVKRSVIEQQTKADDYASLVDAKSQALASLGRIIAAEVEKYYNDANFVRENN